MNKTQKIYLSFAVVSLIAIFFLPIAVGLPQVLPYLSEPSNPDISLFYLAEGFAFFALAFLILALVQNDRGAKKPVSPVTILAAGFAVIYTGYAKILCDLNETNFFVYLTGIMLVLLAIFQKIKR
jgi:hypothetical protein